MFWNFVFKQTDVYRDEWFGSFMETTQSFLTKLSLRFVLVGDALYMLRYIGKSMSSNGVA